ncbi:MAG: GNAT family N-acetyltransferase [Brevibacterium sp.]
MSIELSRITPAHAAHARTLIARAFAADPLLGWLFPPDDWTEERRLDAIAMLYWPSVEAYAARGAGHVVLDGDEMIGVSLWSVPGVGGPSAVLPRSSTVASVLLGSKQEALASAMQGAREQGSPPSTPYLHDLAVAQERQGEGFGAQLLRAGLETWGADGAWLESTNPRNHGLYKRAGFEVVADWPVGDTGVTMSRMVRT